MRGTQMQRLLKGAFFYGDYNMNKIWKLDNEDQFYNNIVYKSKEETLSLITSREKKIYYANIIKHPKKNGFREICIIDKNSGLFDLQKHLKNNFLNNITISDVAYGFIKNLNYYDYLVPHINFYGDSFFLRLDIKDFFRIDKI
jgi:hypothetical protein